MKLRIKGDSLRLRLTRGEVASFAADHALEHHMHLAGGRLTYALRSAPECRQMTARFDNGTLSVVLPRAQADEWANSAAVSLRGRDGPLAILVEKDFACLAPRPGEDDADAFPHPRSAVDE